MNPCRGDRPVAPCPQRFDYSGRLLIPGHGPEGSTQCPWEAIRLTQEVKAAG